MSAKMRVGLILSMIVVTGSSILANATDITLNKKGPNKKNGSSEQCGNGKYSGVAVSFDGTVVKISIAVLDVPWITSPQKEKKYWKDYVQRDGAKVNWEEKECDANDWMMVLSVDANVLPGSISPTITNSLDDPPQNHVSGSISLPCGGRGHDVLRFNHEDKRGSVNGRVLKIGGDQIEFQPSGGNPQIFRASQLEEIVIGDCTQ